MTGRSSALRRAFSAFSRRRRLASARKRATAGVGRIVRLEDRQHAVADQFQHIAARLVDRRDDRIGIVVEEGDDLVRRGGVGDGRVAAQIGEPQHGVDAIGHAARDAAAEHALARIVPEIDLDQGSGDARRATRI